MSTIIPALYASSDKAPFRDGVIDGRPCFVFRNRRFLGFIITLVQNLDSNKITQAIGDSTPPDNKLKNFYCSKIDHLFSKGEFKDAINNKYKQAFIDELKRRVESLNFSGKTNSEKFDLFKALFTHQSLLSVERSARKKVEELANSIELIN